jgi:hypothetical protein
MRGLWPILFSSIGVELLFHSAASIFVGATTTTTTTTAGEDGDNDPTTTTTKSSSSKVVRIAGYLPDYQIESVDLNATLALLDDVYLFSLSPQIQLGDNMFQACCLQPHHYELLEQAMMQTFSTPRPKVWVTVGGAGRSHKLTKAPSSIMMRALTKLIFTDQKILNITGIDWDCELFLDHGDYESYDQLVTAATHIFPPQGIAVSMALVRTCVSDITLCVCVGVGVIVVVLGPGLSGAVLWNLASLTHFTLRIVPTTTKTDDKTDDMTTTTTTITARGSAHGFSHGRPKSGPD